MNTSTRFAVAVHILTLLAQAEDELLTSEYIAASVNTNPVVIRRTLGYLRVQKMVESQPGTGGGWKLARVPGAMTLGEVYRAVENDQVLAIHSHPNPHCTVGGNIRRTLKEVITAAQTAMEESLAQSTIADILQNVLARAKA